MKVWQCFLVASLVCVAQMRAAEEVGTARSATNRQPSAPAGSIAPASGAAQLRFLPGQYRCESGVPFLRWVTVDFKTNGTYSLLYPVGMAGQTTGKETGEWKRKGKDILLTRKEGRSGYDFSRFRIDERFENTLRWVGQQGGGGGDEGGGATEYLAFKRVTPQKP